MAANSESLRSTWAQHSNFITDAKLYIMAKVLLTIYCTHLVHLIFGERTLQINQMLWECTWALPQHPWSHSPLHAMDVLLHAYREHLKRLLMNVS